MCLKLRFIEREREESIRDNEKDLWLKKKKWKKNEKISKKMTIFASLISAFTFTSKK